jgi:hypothetical protein
MFQADAAYILGAGRTVPLPLSVGSAVDLPIQLLLISGKPPRTMTGGDTITLAVAPSRQTAALFAPTFSWYTPGGQTGYDQGQIVASLSNAQGAMIWPSNCYDLLAWWTPAASPGRTQLVARVPIIGKAVAP